MLLACSISFHSVCMKHYGTNKHCSWWDHHYLCVCCLSWFLQHCPLSSQQQHCSRKTSKKRKESAAVNRAVCLICMKHDHKQTACIECRQRFSPLPVWAAGNGSGCRHMGTYKAFKLAGLGCVRMSARTEEYRSVFLKWGPHMPWLCGHWVRLITVYLNECVCLTYLSG